MIKTRFSIKDLENLSGVKAHTIRIWEKRYELFEPLRTETNIRFYTLNDLQKILNVSYLNNIGYKISTIAGLSNKELEKEVAGNSEKANSNIQAVQELKLAMLNFDQHAFQHIYEQGIKKLGFKGVFREIFIPFLQELGTLWHSNTINIAHEHFISYLLRQKLLVALESVQYHKQQTDEKMYILFLPENEMHDLGLLYLNYELLSRGYNSIYLGPSVPTDTLPFFNNIVDNPVFITYFTVFPTVKKIPGFIHKFNRLVASEKPVDLYILGNLAKKIKETDLESNNHVVTDINSLINHLTQVESA